MECRFMDLITWGDAWRLTVVLPSVEDDPTWQRQDYFLSRRTAKELFGDPGFVMGRPDLFFGERARLLEDEVGDVTVFDFLSDAVRSTLRLV